MSNIEIITYRDGYQTKVIDLILAIQAEEFNLDLTIEDQPDLKKIENFYQKDKGNFWLAVDDDQVVGTIALIDIGQNQAVLRKMFVAENYRGKVFGVAQALLDKLSVWCRQQAIKEIYLGTIDIYKAAQRFYEKNQFQEIESAELPSTFPIMKTDNKFYRYILQTLR